MSGLGDGLDVAQKVGVGMAHIEKGANLLRQAAEDGALVLDMPEVISMVAAARADCEAALGRELDITDGALAALIIHLEEATQK
jgi:hypothetical protein